MSRASLVSRAHGARRTPYLREIMDHLSLSHPAQSVVAMAGAEVGRTECVNNWIGYVIHPAPGRC